jgi:hypothetical protein
VVRGALAIAGAAALAGACGSFEDPAIVIDLRLIGMTAEPPEHVIPFDPLAPPEPAELAALLEDTEVCAVVADPGRTRRLTWRMLVCAPTDDLRCQERDDDHPWLEVGTGTIDDPERAATAQRACATVRGGAGLLLVIEDAIGVDPLAGFGGVDVAAVIEVRPEGGDDDDAIFGAKRIRYAPQLPAERVANTNPTLDGLDVVVAGRDPFRLRLGRCADHDDWLQIAAGEDLPLAPAEPDGIREDYVVPTFEGEARMFTEVMTYQWLATEGSWTRGSTGGPRDLSGSFPPLDTRWRTPREIDEAHEVSLWVIQRDERLGAAVFESCVRVVP